MKVTYHEALAIFRRSSAAFRMVQADYRAGRISDAEYLANRKAFRSAELNMERAEAEEEARIDAVYADQERKP